MELRLPSSYEDLTLRHLQVLETSQDPINRVQVVTGKTFAELRKMPQALIVEADAHLTALCKAEINRHQPIIELDGVEYGFIPDWESFTAGEWIDMETYTGDFWKAAHKAMAVLYRPIDRKWGDKYTIKPYTAKEDASVFLDMPAPLVSGALLFFWTTERELHLTLRSSLILYTLAGEDILQVEAVTRLTVGHVFTHLAFMKDLDIRRKQEEAQAKARK
jgi:hypothetical protein